MSKTDQDSTDSPIEYSRQIIPQQSKEELREVLQEWIETTTEMEF